MNTLERKYLSDLPNFLNHFFLELKVKFEPWSIGLGHFIHLWKVYSECWNVNFLYYSFLRVCCLSGSYWKLNNIVKLRYLTLNWQRKYLLVCFLWLRFSNSSIDFKFVLTRVLTRKIIFVSTALILYSKNQYLNSFHFFMNFFSLNIFIFLRWMHWMKNYTDL